MAVKKKFIDVEIPIIGSTVEVLETTDNTSERTIKLDLSRKMKGRGVEVVFSMFEHDGQIIAIPKKISLLKAYIRRMMRKRTNYVEDSFKTKAKDVEVTIKPFLITRKKVSRAVRRNLRNTAKEFLTTYVQEKTYIELCDEILSGALQREMLPKLKKVYPLSFNDLRVFETDQIKQIDLNAAFEKKNIKKEKKTQAEEISEELEKARELVKKKQEEKEKEEKIKEKETKKESEEGSEEASKEKKEKKTKKTSKTETKEE